MFSILRLYHFHSRIYRKFVFVIQTNGVGFGLYMEFDKKCDRFHIEKNSGSIVFFRIESNKLKLAKDQTLSIW